MNFVEKMRNLHDNCRKFKKNAIYIGYPAGFLKKYPFGPNVTSGYPPTVPFRVTSLSQSDTPIFFIVSPLIYTKKVSYVITCILASQWLGHAINVVK